MKIIFKNAGKTKMTLDQAIKHARKRAKELGSCPCGCEHGQLADWLKELKAFKDGFCEAGRAADKGFTEKDADPKELAMGVKIEMEHTTNKDISKKISLDHLSEISDYYQRLKRMEEDAGIED